jgi:transglutaminase-like putative cysteine protease
MTMAPPAPTVEVRPGRPQGGPPASVAKPRLPSGHPAGSADFSATVALTALTLASTYGLHRLFAGSTWIAPVAITALTVHAVLWACRRLELRVAGAACLTAVSVALVISWLVVPQTTAYGLPVGHTLHAAGQDLGQAWRDFKVVVAPTPVSHGFLLATLLAVAVIAVLADWAAFRIRATVEAVVPAFTLFVFICALGTHADRAGTVAVELAAILGFIIVHQVSIDRRSTAWFAGRTDGALASAARVGSMIGVAAVAAALVLGPDLPGYGSGAALPLARHSDQPGARSTISPLVDIRTRLIDESNQEVFTVKASRPEYWRLTSLDTFDGTEWSSNESYAPVRDGRPLANDPVDPQVPVGTTVDQQVMVGGLGSLWLPAAFKPIQVTNISGVSFSPRSSSLIPASQTADGLSYQVKSVVLIAQLDAGRLGSAAPVPSAGSVARYLRLPALRSDVIDLARRITGTARTEYDKARALEAFFRSPPFVYSTSPAPGGDGTDALEVFLFRTHSGYCQQYAGAYAVLARLAGLPTRVAVGFTPGDLEADQLYHVRDLHAHAWPEVLFPGIGWVPFEPTPGRGIPDAQQYTGVAPAQATGGLPDSSTTTTPGATVPAPAPNSARPQPRETSTSAAGRHHSSIPGLLSGTARWLGWLLLAGGALLLVNRAGWSFWRRHRRAKAPGPSGRVLVAWADAADALSWWGVERLPSETLFEFVRRVPLVLTLPHGPELEVNSALRDLAVEATAAEFGPPGAAAGGVERSQEAAHRIRRALTDSASIALRVRALLDSRLLMASLRRGVPAPAGSETEERHDLSPVATA